MRRSSKGLLLAISLAVLASMPSVRVRAADPPAIPVRRPPRLPVEIVIGAAEGTGHPTIRGCSAHAGGGNITVSRIDPTTVVITMTGIAVAQGNNVVRGSSASYQFDHALDFTIVVNSPDIKSAKLNLEAVVVGRLRSQCECSQCGKRSGTAQITTPGTASVTLDTKEVAAVHLPAREACCCDSQTIYNREGPVVASVAPGRYTLHGTFGFEASAPPSFLNRFAAADFSPEWVLDLRQFGYPEPFIAYGNKDFGFTITLKVVPE
jgi:hypothetical protein